MRMLLPQRVSASGSFQMILHQSLTTHIHHSLVKRHMLHKRLNYDSNNTSTQSYATI
ncbi:hypothetical protein Hanom_Chr15g01370391 [Helianthus anomalus]